MKIVVLLSGGLDSATALYQLKKAGHELKALGIHYGQRHKKELKAAEQISAGLGIDFKIADLSAIQSFLAGNSQTSENVDVPEGHYTAESMKLTVVPNRNMIMLSVAMGWAISLKFEAVAYAAHAGDHTIYPDCRPEFVESIRKTAQLCDWHQLDVLTPFIHSTKADIVREGLKLDLPFAKTWSCYKGGELHCGHCGTCVERKEAFQLAGVPDPTIYEERFS